MRVKLSAQACMYGVGTEGSAFAGRDLKRILEFWSGERRVLDAEAKDVRDCWRCAGVLVVSRQVARMRASHTCIAVFVAGRPSEVGNAWRQRSCVSMLEHGNLDAFVPCRSGGRQLGSERATHKRSCCAIAGRRQLQLRCRLSQLPNKANKASQHERVPHTPEGRLGQGRQQGRNLPWTPAG